MCDAFLNEEFLLRYTACLSKGGTKSFWQYQLLRAKRASTRSSLEEKRRQQWRDLSQALEEAFKERHLICSGRTSPKCLKLLSRVGTGLLAYGAACCREFVIPSRGAFVFCSLKNVSSDAHFNLQMRMGRSSLFTRQVGDVRRGR